MTFLLLKLLECKEQVYEKKESSGWWCKNCYPWGNYGNGCKSREVKKHGFDELDWHITLYKNNAETGKVAILLEFDVCVRTEEEMSNSNDFLIKDVGRKAII